MFTILLSVFFDAMGVSVGLAAEAGTMKDGRLRTLTGPACETLSAPLLVVAHRFLNQIFVESATGIGANYCFAGL